MMYTGIAGNAADLIDSDRRAILRDTGATHLKVKAHLTDDVSRYVDLCERAAAIDMEVIPDIRLAGGAFMGMTQAVGRLTAKMRQESPYKELGDEAAIAAAIAREEDSRGRKLDPDERQRIAQWLCVVQTRALMNDACRQPIEPFADMMQAIAAGTKGLMHRFEFWGEPSCPVVTQGSFSMMDYSLIFAAISDAAKIGNPDIEVWNGGNGVALNVLWLQDFIAPIKYHPDAAIWYPDGIGDKIDVINWHHYYHTRYVPGQVDDGGRVVGENMGLEAALEAYNEAWRLAKNITLLSRNQPFASSEWGLPTLQDSERPVDQYGKAKSLYSAAYAGGVMPLLESLAPLWFDTLLGNFDEAGFKIVCIHDLFDTASSKGSSALHWGNFCGLIAEDGRIKPQFATVQEWCHKGRAQGHSEWWRRPN